MINTTVTKKHLVEAIARKLQLHPTQVLLIIQAFLDETVQALHQHQRIELRGFGVFEVVKRKAKVGRNPKKAGVDILIPEHDAVKFSPGKQMKIDMEQR